MPGKSMRRLGHKVTTCAMGLDWGFATTPASALSAWTSRRRLIAGRESTASINFTFPSDNHSETCERPAGFLFGSGKAAASHASTAFGLGASLAHRPATRSEEH